MLSNYIRDNGDASSSNVTDLTGDSQPFLARGPLPSLSASLFLCTAALEYVTDVISSVQ